MRTRKTSRRTLKTPKVFQSAYAPPRRTDWSQYRALWPVGLVLAVVVIIYLIGRLPALRVQSVEITGTDNPELVTALQKLKGDSLLSGSLSSNVNHIQSTLLTISNLNCRRGIPGTLRCHSSLRNPAIFWKSDGHIYAVDENGFVFAVQDAGTGSVLVEDRSNAAVKLGQTVASAQTVTNYLTLSKTLSDNHLQVGELYISDTLFQCGAVLTGSTDPTVPFAAKSPISVLFTLDQPIVGQVATLVEILKDKHDQIHDHVDLRVPGSAYIQ